MRNFIWDFFERLTDSIDRISLLHVIPLDHYLIKDKSEIKNEIITIVEKACQELDSNILDYLEHGISINLLIFPTNNKDELSGLMQRLIINYEWCY